LLAESKAEGDAFLDALRAARSRMAPSFPDIVLNAAAKVALASEPIEPNVQVKLRAVADALQFDEATVRAAIAAARPA
jgi:hypothetical protein